MFLHVPDLQHAHAAGMFLQMDVAKQAARAAGQQVVDLSVGASDLPAPPEALQTLQVGRLLAGDSIIATIISSNCHQSSASLSSEGVEASS